MEILDWSTRPSIKACESFFLSFMDSYRGRPATRILFLRRKFVLSSYLTNYQWQFVNAVRERDVPAQQNLHSIGGFGRGITSWWSSMPGTDHELEKNLLLFLRRTNQKKMFVLM